jgi:hypothetical protein
MPLMSVHLVKYHRAGYGPRKIKETPWKAGSRSTHFDRRHEVHGDGARGFRPGLKRRRSLPRSPMSIQVRKRVKPHGGSRLLSPPPPTRRLPGLGAWTCVPCPAQAALLWETTGGRQRGRNSTSHVNMESLLSFRHRRMCALLPHSQDRHEQTPAGFGTIASNILHDLPLKQEERPSRASQPNPAVKLTKRAESSRADFTPHPYE